MKKLIALLFVSTLLTACGDFPDYRYDQSQQYCVIKFPFAGGFFERKYVGYFNITSTLQYLDADPEMQIFIGGPSHIELEPGSVQKVEIADKVFLPKFEKNFLHGELQYWGPAFLFDDKQTEQIYQLLKEGNNLTIHGRLEVGAQYETELYNFFFDSDEEPFLGCVNRLLEEDDIKAIVARKLAHTDS